jgi:hypothetical protein
MDNNNDNDDDNNKNQVLFTHKIVCVSRIGPFTNANQSSLLVHFLSIIIYCMHGEAPYTADTIYYYFLRNGVDKWLEFAKDLMILISS